MHSLGHFGWHPRGSSGDSFLWIDKELQLPWEVRRGRCSASAASFVPFSAMHNSTYKVYNLAMRDSTHVISIEFCRFIMFRQCPTKERKNERRTAPYIQSKPSCAWRKQRHSLCLVRVSALFPKWLFHLTCRQRKVSRDDRPEAYCSVSCKWLHPMSVFLFSHWLRLRFTPRFKTSETYCSKAARSEFQPTRVRLRSDSLGCFGGADVGRLSRRSFPSLRSWQFDTFCPLIFEVWKTAVSSAMKKLALIVDKRFLIWMLRMFKSLMGRVIVHWGLFTAISVNTHNNVTGKDRWFSSRWNSNQVPKTFPGKGPSFKAEVVGN